MFHRDYLKLTLNVCSTHRSTFLGAGWCLYAFCLDVVARLYFYIQVLLSLYSTFMHVHTHRMSGGNPELLKAMVDHGFLGNASSYMNIGYT